MNRTIFTISVLICSYPHLRLSEVELLGLPFTPSFTRDELCFTIINCHVFVVKIYRDLYYLDYVSIKRRMPTCY